MYEFTKKYKVDLIEIPEEFQDLEVEDDFKPTRSRRQSARRRLYQRSSTSLEGYDAWRAFDRFLAVPTAKNHAVCKLEIAPALLQKAFGFPCHSESGEVTSGMYHFEDSNLDMYRLVDYK